MGSRSAFPVTLVRVCYLDFFLDPYRPVSFLIAGSAMVTRCSRLRLLARSITVKSVMDEDFRDTILRRLRPTFVGDAEGAHQDLADAHVLPAD